MDARQSISSAVPGAPEQVIDSCFLCSPDPALVAHEGKHAFVIAGLGPVVENYCIIGCRSHCPSLADLYRLCPEAIAEIETVRSELQRRLGPVLMTEHGRVPVCRDDSDDHESHCFHAHALLFPAQAAIETAAMAFYRQATDFSELREALEYAASARDYLLISAGAERHLVLSDALNAPRQLARTLIAHELGVLDRADWRISPRRDEAIANAQRLAELLRSS